MRPITATILRKDILGNTMWVCYKAYAAPMEHLCWNILSMFADGMVWGNVS